MKTYHNNEDEALDFLKLKNLIKNPYVLILAIIYLSCLFSAIYLAYSALK